jgi:hypothetical protein
MAEQDSFRVAAEIVDKFSVPLRDFTRQLQALSKLSQQQQKEGVIGTKEHIKWFRELHQTTHRLSDEVKGVLTPAMAAFGVGSLSVAGAIAAITKSVGDFGSVARNLSNLSQFSGLSVQSVRVYEELAAAIGSSKAEFDGFITSFSTNMDQWRRLGRGPLPEFFAQNGSQIRDVGIALRQTKDNAEALDIVFDFLADNRYTDVQKKLATDAWGLSAAFVHAGPSLGKLRAQLNADVKPFDRGWEQRNKQYLDSMALLSASWSSLSLHIGDAMSPGFARAGESLRGFLDQHGKEIEKFAVDAEHWLESVNWAAFAGGVEEVAKDIGDAARAVNTLVENTAGWKPVLEFLLVYKAANILGLTSAIRGLAGSFGLLSAVTLPAWMVALMAGGGAYRLATAPGESLGVTGPRSVGGNIKELWGMATGTKPSAAAPAAPPAAAAPSDKTWLQRMREGLFHKESYTGGFEAEGPNPLRAARSSIRFPAEETLGGGNSTSDAINTIAIGTRKGVYDGMIDYYQYLLGTKGGAGESAGGGAGGVIRAAYGPGGQGGAPAGTGRAGRLGGGIGEGGEGEGGLPAYPTSLDELRGGAAAGKPGKGDPRDMLAAVRQAAIRNGINPDLMERVARHEGLSGKFAGGDSGTSFGAMQLHYGGVGTAYERATGHKLNDPRNEKEQTDFAAKYIAKHGWGEWMGARAAGVTGRTGVGIDTSRWSKELEPGKAPRLTLGDIRKRMEGAGSVGDQIKQTMGGAETAVGGAKPAAFIMHHTAGRGTVASVMETLRQRGLGVQYIMDRDGNIIHTGGPGSQNIKDERGRFGTDLGRRLGLNNQNIVGMEIIAKNDRDVLKKQIEAAKAFIAKNYPDVSVYGHGEVQQDKEPDEGHSVVEAIREARRNAPETAGLHGAALREHFGHRGTRHADLLDDARKAGMAGTMQHKVTGRAGVDINFHNMPRGTTTQASSSGIFNEVKLARGRTPRANEEA